MQLRTVLSQDGRANRPFRLSFVAVTLLALSVSALAQSTAGRILGTLTDPSGAAVPGATVLVTDVERGTSRTSTTDESGSYDHRRGSATDQHNLCDSRRDAEQ